MTAHTVEHEGEASTDIHVDFDNFWLTTGSIHYSWRRHTDCSIHTTERAHILLVLGGSGWSIGRGCGRRRRAARWLDVALWEVALLAGLVSTFAPAVSVVPFQYLQHLVWSHIQLILTLSLQAVEWQFALMYTSTWMYCNSAAYVLCSLLWLSILCNFLVMKSPEWLYC